MDLKEIVAISGMGGLFKVVAKRGDGLIVSGFDDDRAKFVPNRLHVFTPLDGITLYTHTDNIELSKVLLEIKKQESTNKPVDANGDNELLKEYFRKIVPDFDDERVYVSDIRKVIKWYHLLDAKGLVKETEKVEEVKEEAKPKAKHKAEKAAETETAEKEVKAKKAPKPKEKAETVATDEKPKEKKAAKPKAKK